MCCGPIWQQRFSLGEILRIEPDSRVAGTQAALAGLLNIIGRALCGEFFGD